jgi:hypothetical protein
MSLINIIHLQVIPCHASELLPIFNKTSLQVYKSSRQVGDWSDPNRSATDPSSAAPRRKFCTLANDLRSANS